MPSSKWRVEQTGPGWLMDASGRLLGYRDELGNEYLIPNALIAGGVTDDTTPIETGGGGGGGGMPVVSSAIPVQFNLPSNASAGTPTYGPDQACTELVLNAPTATLEYTRDAGANWGLLVPGQSRRFVGLTNANQLGFRRKDYASRGTLGSATALSGVAITSSEAFTFRRIVAATITNGGGGLTLGSVATDSVEIINTSLKDILVRQPAAATNGTLVKVGQSLVLQNVGNLNTINLRTLDSVADGNQGTITLECYSGSIPQQGFSVRPVAEIISDSARIPIGDFYFPDQFPTKVPHLNMGEVAAGPRRTLWARGFRLAYWDLAANAVHNAGGQVADATGGEPVCHTTSSVEFTQTAANGAYSFGSSYVAPQGYDLTKGMVRCTVSFPRASGQPAFSDSNALNSISVDVFSSGSASAPPTDYHTWGGGGFDQRLVFSTAEAITYSFSIPYEAFAAVGNGATLTAVTWARFRLNTGAAGNGAKFRPYMIEFVPKALTKAVVIFTIDDYNRGALSNMLPILSKYGYPATLYADSVRAMSWTALAGRELFALHHRHGWQIANQNYRVETTAPESNEQVLEQHSKYQLAMRALGINDVEDSSFGSAAVNNFRGDNFASLRRMHRSAALFLNASDIAQPISFPETAPPGDPHRMARWNMSSFAQANLLTRWTTIVDQAIAQKGVALFGAHTEFNAGGAALTALSSLVDYIRTQELAGNVEVLTVARFLEKCYPRD